MTLIKPDSLKNPSLVRVNLLLTGIKILLFIFICQSLKYFFKPQDFWILPVWVALTVLIDGFLILKKPKLFEKIDLTEEEQHKYDLSTEELIRYLNFSPKIRLVRTLLATFIVLIFFKSSDWVTAFLTTVFLGFIILDPVFKYLFNIKTPLIYKNSPYRPTESLHEVHKNDSYWPGSAAWTAVRSTKQFDNYPKL